jgi:hypothetical protein
MIDCGCYVMCATPCRDCVIAVTETRNVTPRLGRSERRALQVLTEAGLVPSPVSAAVTTAFEHEWCRDASGRFTVPARKSPQRNAAAGIIGTG